MTESMKNVNTSIQDIQTITPIPHSKKGSSIFLENSPNAKNLFTPKKKSPKSKKDPLLSAEFSTPRKRHKSNNQKSESSLKSLEKATISSKAKRVSLTAKNDKSEDIDEKFNDIGEKLQFLAQHNRSAHQRYKTEIESLTSQLETKKRSIAEIKSRQEDYAKEKKRLENQVSQLRSEKNTEISSLKSRIKHMKNERLELQKVYRELSEKADYNGMSELNKKLLAKSRILNKTENQLLDANKELVGVIKGLSSKITLVNQHLNEEERGLRVLEFSKSNLSEQKLNLTMEYDKIEKLLEEESREKENVIKETLREQRIKTNINKEDCLTAYESGFKMLSKVLGLKTKRPRMAVKDIENSFYRIFQVLSFRESPHSNSIKSKPCEISNQSKTLAQTQKTLQLLRHLKNSNNTLKEQLTKIKKTPTSSRNNNEELLNHKENETKLKQSNEQIENLRKTIQRQTKENEMAANKISSLEQTLQIATKRIKSYEEKIANLMSLNKSLSKNAKKPSKSMENSIELQKKILEQSQNKVNTLEGALSKLRVQFESVQAISKDRLARLESYEKQMASLKTKLKRRDEEIGGLRRAKLFAQRLFEREQSAISIERKLSLAVQNKPGNEI